MRRMTEAEIDMFDRKGIIPSLNAPVQRRHKLAAVKTARSKAPAVVDYARQPRRTGALRPRLARTA